MDNVLGAFATRAAALFVTLPVRDTTPSFQLQVAAREDLNVRSDNAVEDVAATEPAPSPMTWTEVVDGSKNVEFDDEERLCEISVEARKAFEAEADYDEFDEVATGTIQFGYEEREKEELNREVPSIMRLPGTKDVRCFVDRLWTQMQMGLEIDIELRSKRVDQNDENV